MRDKKGDIYGLHEVLNTARDLPACRLVIVAPYDAATLLSVSDAQREGVVKALLVGDEKKILECAEKNGVSFRELHVLHSEEESMVERAASMLRNDRADIIMKGIVGTGDFLHILLDPRWGVRTARILSHVGLFEIPETRRLFLMSDAGVNILPNFSRKIHIVANAVDAARKIGIKEIRVAMLAAVEKVHLPAMPATLDAFLMERFSHTGYFGRCEVEGPFAFDNAIDPGKADTKGIRSSVAGRANVLVTPNIETGNVIWKSITCLQRGQAAGVVMGGAFPIVVPSRADDRETKLLSIKFSRLLLGKRRTTRGAGNAA
ncbi:MAG: phosphate butyryltransferase [Spirochaetes bacterium]|nr:phosphate butyryltransferase [Spirochaetota bacterium]